MHPSERVWLAVIAVVLALMIETLIYGYVQMVRHRRPGIPAASLLWPPEYLSQRGREFRRRALCSYALFAGLALFLVALNYLVRP
jgi:hypothetical protein